MGAEDEVVCRGVHKVGCWCWGGVGIKGLWGRDERVYGWRWDI